MYIRKTAKKDRKTGKDYYTYQLIESYRSERGPRQRILLNIGNSISLTDIERKELANRIEDIVTGSNTFLNISEHLEEYAQQLVAQLIKEDKLRPKQPQLSEENEEESDFQTIDVNQVSLERVRSIGVEHICLETLRELGFDRKLDKLGFSKKQAAMALGAIIGRLAGCCSERQTLDWLQKRSGLGELIEVNFGVDPSNKSIYSIADQLLSHKSALEKHLAKKELELFEFDNTVLLYDLTNTHFEGKLQKASLAKKGRSKEKRSDAPLATLGLLVNSAGFALKSDVYEGNISESKIFVEVVHSLCAESPTKPVIVVDAGMATESNLRWLRKNNYKYIVCSRQRDIKIADNLDYQLVSREGKSEVYASSVCDVHTKEMRMFCHSKARERGELQWLESTRETFEAELIHIREGLTQKNRIKKFDTVTQRIGRLRERYRRLSKYYQIQIVTDKSNEYVTDLTWEFNEEESSTRFRGLYCIRAFDLNYDTKKLWRTYTLLTEIEEAFRCLKTDLGLRPVYHQTDDRIRAHLFLSVLAYHVLRIVLYRLSKEGIATSWTTLRNGMSTQSLVSVTAPTKEGGTLHIRSATTPEPYHRTVYRALGISQKPGPKTKAYL